MMLTVNNTFFFMLNEVRVCVAVPLCRFWRSGIFHGRGGADV